MRHDVAITSAQAIPFHLLADTRDAEPLQTARAILTARRALNGPLSPLFIPNPALEIVLTLFVADAEGNTLGEADLCAATTVAPATSRRWIGALREHGMLQTTGATCALTANGREAATVAMRAVIAMLREALLIA